VQLHSFSDVRPAMHSRASLTSVLKGAEPTLANDMFY